MLRTKEEFDQLYQHHEDPWYLSWRGSQQVRYEMYKTMLLPIIQKNNTLLDVGCGKGYFTKQLSEMHCFSSITSVDISIQAIQQAKEICKNNKKIHFITDSLPSLALITNTFDVVLALEVIYYLRTLEDQKQALLQLYGLVKNNGYALFSVNLGEGYFNEHDFLKMVTEPGFVICDTRYLRNTWYILYERKMCWFYDAAKELKNKSFFLCPIFYCLELIVRCFLSSKIIARIGFFLSIFSKKAPSVLCILLKKEINE